MNKNIKEPARDIIQIKAHWKQQLADLPPLLELPIDRPRSSTASYDSAHFSFSISNVCSEALRNVSRKMDITLFTTLLTAFKVLLYRYTNQEDIVVGHPIIHHTVSKSGELQRYLNTLLLRTGLSGNPRFSELSKRVGEVVSDALVHKDLPLEMLIDTLKREQELDPSSLFQVIFAFLSDTDPDMKIGDLFGSAGIRDFKMPSSDLCLSIEDSSQGLVGVWQYNASLFDTDTIKRMTGHFQMLLEGLTADPEQSISCMPLLSEGERHQLLFDWNNTYAEFPEERCIHELFEQQVQRDPNAVAVIFDHERLTYRELNEKSNQLSHYLRKIGVKEEVLVPVCMNRSLEMIIAILGILKAGGAYVPIDPQYPSNRIQYMLKDTKAEVILSTTDCMDILQSADTVKVINIREDWNIISKQPIVDPAKTAKPSNLAYVIYTSGSTGVPKGVMIEHHNVYSFLCWCSQEFSSSRFEIMYASTSICFDLSVFEIFWPLSIGKPFRIIENGLHIGKYLSGDSGVFINSVPSIIQSLLSEEIDLSSMSVLNMAGEPIPLQIQQSLDADKIEIRNLYGPTEDTTYSTVFRLKNGMPALIGKPISNTQIYIVSKENQLSPIGVTGEIYIGGAGMARGYLNRPELTAERFISNPFSNKQNDRVYKTGDLARYLDDGSIVYLGRQDHQVKIRGYRIELGEIESALMSSGWLDQAVVVAKADHENNKRLIGYYVPKWQMVKAKELDLYERQVENWKNIYDAEYTPVKPSADEEFDVAIWKDSFTGKPIGEDQMHDWLQDIIEVIHSEKIGNVLEIGCGTGLIYFQLANKVNKYIGTDFSPSSINHINRRIQKGLRDYGHTVLKVCAAHQISLDKEEQVDTIIMNSVAQYFPGEQYMNEVAGKCMSFLKEGGRIIIGDVRDNRLLELFKIRLHMQKADDSVSMQEFKWAIEQEVRKEEELCLSPEYFYRLQSIYPQISHIEIKWKNCSSINELTLYRFTVVIHVGTSAEPIDPDWQDWKDVKDSRIVTKQLEEGSPMIALLNVPNFRIWKERLINKALKEKSVHTVGELLNFSENEDEESLEIKDILRTAEAKGYHMRLLLNEDPLRINIVLELHFSGRGIHVPYHQKAHEASYHYTNIPLLDEINLSLQNDLKALLKERLPVYMIPSIFMFMQALPLTPNRKVDRAALPAPDIQRPKSDKAFVGPRNVLELQLVKIFEKCLKIHPIGVQDNFFELGANSLQAGYIFSRIRKTLSKQIHLATLLQAPTIEQLAEFISKEEKTTSWSPLVPIQPNGSKPPLFCIHGGVGTVLFYRDLANHLGTDQPFYGLQAKGLNGMGTPHTNIHEMATDYIKEIRTIQPEGPYYLGGYCFGGVVAFEMAKQLTDLGLEVALLANFNAVSPTYTPSAEPTTKNEEIQYTGRSKSLLGKFSALRKKMEPLSLKEKFVYVLSVLKNKVIGYKMLLTYLVLLKIQRFVYKLCIAFKLPMPDAVARFYLWEMNGRMIDTYRPKPYSGNMVIFRSPEIYTDPNLGWSDYVKGSIETCDIAGDHTNRREIMNEPFVHLLAEELSGYIGMKRPESNSFTVKNNTGEPLTAT